MIKRIILIFFIALLTSVPVTFLIDAIFTSMNTVLSGIIGFTLISILPGFLIVMHEKIKPKSMTTKILVFCSTMIAYITLSLIILIAFFFFVILIGMHRG